MKASDYDELALGSARTVQDYNDAQVRKQLCALARVEGEQRVLLALKMEAQELHDEAFRARALGQESLGKQKEETAKYLLSLVASLPTKLRAQ